MGTAVLPEERKVLLSIVQEHFEIQKSGKEIS
jgi:hypothetical protein